MDNTLKMVVKHGTMPTDNKLDCCICESEITAGQRVQFSRAYIEYASELVSHVECSAKALKDSKSTLPYWWGR
jgi:hypothetical protein